MNKEAYLLTRKMILERRDSIKKELCDLKYRLDRAYILRLNHRLYDRLKRIKFGGFDVCYHALQEEKIVIKIRIGFDIIDLEVRLDNNNRMTITNKTWYTKYYFKNPRHAARRFVQACRIHGLIVRYLNTACVYDKARKVAFGIYGICDDVMHLSSLNNRQSYCLTIYRKNPPDTILSINIDEAFVHCNNSILLTGNNLQDPDTRIIVPIEKGIFWYDDLLYYHGTKFKLPRAFNVRFSKIAANGIKTCVEYGIKESDATVHIDGQNYHKMYRPF